MRRLKAVFLLRFYKGDFWADRIDFPKCRRDGISVETVSKTEPVSPLE